MPMFDSNEVLLDPSILVADAPETELVGQRTLDQFTEGGSGVSLYVPAAFADVVANRDAYREDSTFELFLGDISSGITEFDELQALLDDDDPFVDAVTEVGQVHDSLVLLSEF